MRDRTFVTITVFLADDGKLLRLERDGAALAGASSVLITNPDLAYSAARLYGLEGISVHDERPHLAERLEDPARWVVTIEAELR